jgi:cbb3-type cytochrome oxidase subunit 1
MRLLGGLLYLGGMLIMAWNVNDHGWRARRPAPSPPRGAHA